jgi:hypothetical protein
MQQNIGVNPVHGGSRWQSLHPSLTIPYSGTTLLSERGKHPALGARPAAADVLYQAAIARFLTTGPGVPGDWLVRQGKADPAVNGQTEQEFTRHAANLARRHAQLRLDRPDELAKRSCFVQKKSCAVSRARREGIALQCENRVK